MRVSVHAETPGRTRIRLSFVGIAGSLPAPASIENQTGGFAGDWAGPPGPSTRPSGSVTLTSRPLGAPLFDGLTTTVTLSFGFSVLLFQPARVSIPVVPISRLHCMLPPWPSGTTISSQAWGLAH